MGRPRSHDEATRAALLREAEKILVASGPDAISVRGVAQAVGTSTRAVYAVFGSKERLLVALYGEAFATMTRIITAVSMTDDPIADLVRLGIEGFRRFALEHPNSFRLVFERSFALELTTEAFASSLTAFGHLQKFVRRCLDTGLFGKRVLMDVTMEFHAACHGLAAVELRGWLLHRGNPVEVWEELLHAVVRGFTVKTAPKPETKRGVKKRSRARGDRG